MRPTYTKRRNFSEQEKSLLFSLIGKEKHVLECRDIKAHTLEEKRKSWEKITLGFNADSSVVVVPRTVEELRKCWMNQRYREKQIAAAERKRRASPQEYGENPTSPATMNVEVDPVILNRSPEPVQNAWEDDLSIKNEGDGQMQGQQQQSMHQQQSQHQQTLQQLQQQQQPQQQQQQPQQQLQLQQQQQLDSSGRTVFNMGTIPIGIQTNTTPRTSYRPIAPAPPLPQVQSTNVTNSSVPGVQQVSVARNMQFDNATVAVSTSAPTIGSTTVAASVTSIPLDWPETTVSTSSNSAGSAWPASVRTSQKRKLDVLLDQDRQLASKQLTTAKLEEEKGRLQLKILHEQLKNVQRETHLIDRKIALADRKIQYWDKVLKNGGDEHFLSHM